MFSFGGPLFGKLMLTKALANHNLYKHVNLLEIKRPLPMEHFPINCEVICVKVSLW